MIVTLMILTLIGIRGADSGKPRENNK